MQTHATKIVDGRLLISGYAYVKNAEGGDDPNRVYWDCDQLQTKECKATAVTENLANGNIVVIKGPEEKPFHLHPPSREDCQANVVKPNLKRKAELHSDDPPLAQLSRGEDSVLIEGVNSFISFYIIFSVKSFWGGSDSMLSNIC